MPNTCPHCGATGTLESIGLPTFARCSVCKVGFDLPASVVRKLPRARVLGSNRHPSPRSEEHCKQSVQGLHSQSGQGDTSETVRQLGLLKQP